MVTNFKSVKIVFAGTIAFVSPPPISTDFPVFTVIIRTAVIIHL